MAVLIATSQNPTLSEVTLALRASKNATLAFVTEDDVLRAVVAAGIAIRNNRVARADLSTLYFNLNRRHAHA